ncbi:hypothetical protein [Shouchella patagoniensis]|uniref:hypothetical protein n=1 Tax=Shouchella patagoniensis TaxID=228576 RepID=UPI000995DCB0|nr:hypothetical protein [Shouchella patagoniensis]
MQRIYYAAVLFLVFIALAFDLEQLLWISGLLALPMLFYSFIHSNRLFRGMGIAFLVGGAILLSYSDVAFRTLPALFSNNLTLVVFVAVVPLMQAAIETLRYDRQVESWLFKQVKNTGSLQNRSLITTYSFVPFMNLSVLPLLQNTLNNRLQQMDKAKRDGLISRTTLRGYALALVWMPMEIMVVTALGITGQSYVSVLPYLLLLSVMMTGYELLKNKWWRTGRLREIEIREERGRSKKSLVLAVLLFLVLVIGIGEWLQLSFIMTVILLIPLFAYSWTRLMGEAATFVHKGQVAFSQQLAKGIHPFIVLFVSLGWFTGILNGTELLTLIQEPLLVFQDVPIVLLMGIPLSFYALAMIGIHPIASMVLVHEIVGPILAPTMSLALTIMYIVSALATFTISPYGIVVTMTARNTEQNPYRIMLKNLPFALLFGALAVGVAILFT